MTVAASGSFFRTHRSTRQKLLHPISAIAFSFIFYSALSFSGFIVLLCESYDDFPSVCHIFEHPLDYFLCILVGYIADFICYVANDVVQIQMNLPLRILALLLAQLMASMGVALYMVADMGIAPYDSVATIIEKLTHQKIPFHKARITIHQFLQGSYPERIRAFLFHQ